MFDYLAVKSYFNKWKKLSIGIDFGIGIDQNSWYRTGIVSKPKKLVSPITNVKGAALIMCHGPRGTLIRPWCSTSILFFLFPR
jgi:hypothetical protein